MKLVVNNSSPEREQPQSEDQALDRSLRKMQAAVRWFYRLPPVKPTRRPTLQELLQREPCESIPRNCYYVIRQQLSESVVKNTQPPESDKKPTDT